MSKTSKFLLTLAAVAAVCLGFAHFTDNGKQFGSGVSTQTIGGNLVVVGTLTANGGVTAASQTVTALTVGTGKAAVLFTSATSSLNFDAIANGTCSSTTMTVTGATTSTASPVSVSLGFDPALKSGYATNTQWSAWASAPDTVSVEGCAGTSTLMLNPPALVFRATVMNFNP